MKDRACSLGNNRRKEHKTQFCMPLSPVFTRDCGGRLNFIDEPTNGLDIITARAVLDYLRMLKERGKTIIVSTHVMSEAQKLCDRIAIIIDGKLAAMGTLEELEAQTGSGDLEDAFFEFYKQYEKEA